MMEERAHATDLVIEMDRKIATRLQAIRGTVANIAMPAQGSRPSPAPPAAAPVEPEPAAAAPTRKHKGVREALIDLAERNGGALYIDAARREPSVQAFLTGTAKQVTKKLQNALYQSARFEKLPERGRYRSGRRASGRPPRLRRASTRRASRVRAPPCTRRWSSMRSRTGWS